MDFWFYNSDNSMKRCLCSKCTLNIDMFPLFLSVLIKIIPIHRIKVEHPQWDLSKHSGHVMWMQNNSLWYYGFYQLYQCDCEWKHFNWDGIIHAEAIFTLRCTVFLLLLTRPIHNPHYLDLCALSILSQICPWSLNELISMYNFLIS